MSPFQTARYPLVRSPLAKGLFGLPLLLGLGVGLLGAASASGDDKISQNQDLVGGRDDRIDVAADAAIAPDPDATDATSEPEDAGDDVEVVEEDECALEEFRSRHVLPLVPLTSTSDADPRPTSSSLPEGADAEPEPAKAPKYRVQREKVYFGNPRRFTSPAMLSAAKVYAKIPAYRKILDRRLTKDDPEYWPLMRRASAAFVRGLKSVCSNDGYDLVGELGSIAPVGKPQAIPDITRAVTAAVRRVSIVRRPAGGGEADDEAVVKELVNFPDFGD